MHGHPINVAPRINVYAGGHAQPLVPGEGPSPRDDALAAAADWVWEADAFLRVVRVSPTCPEATGIPSADVIGRTLEELLLRFPADQADLADQIQVLVAHMPFRNLTLRLWDGHDGAVRQFVLSGRPIADAEGHFAGYRGVGTEVTREAERQTRESEGRFRAIFDHAALGIALVGKGGRVARVNQALVDMFGYSPQESVRLTFRQLTHPEDRQADTIEACKLVRGEIDSYSRENRYLRKDGSVFWGRLTVSLLPTDGADRFAVAMIEDIDDRKRAEAKLSLFRAVMDSSHEAIAILAPSGHVLYSNSAFGALFGVGNADAVGGHYLQYFPPESREVLDKLVAPALVRGEGWEGVLEAVDASGRRFPLWQRSGAVREGEGRVRFYFAFMHDHSAQQMFEDELYDAKETAEEAAVAKTRFLAAASHDLRQPLQALAMFVAVLAGRTREPEQAALVSRIQDSVSALEGLLNGLLDVSKLEAGLIVPVQEDFTARSMMQRLAAEFEPLCEAEGLGFRVVPTTHMVKSDPSLLERILRNLLNNATRYTKAGRILFGCRRHGRTLRFEVWDTGIGIPTAELKNIFREFHQVGNPGRDRRQGLGLGLAIVERLAGLLGHRVTVSSVEGKGSVFAVEVPVASGAEAARPKQLPLGLAHTGAAVLVIDDEPDVREGLELLLESWGHVAVAAASAEEAIRLLPLLGRTPDLILADYRLQNGDTGGQAIARVEVHLRAETRIPAIILTGDTAPERLVQAQALGHGLLHKPVQPDALRAAIDQELARGARARRRTTRTRKSKRG